MQLNQALTTGAALGIDTATAACAVAVRSSDGQIHEAPSDPARLFERPAHARELLPRIRAVLAAADASFADLTMIATGIGPGGFTGLRIGVTTARSLASALGCALIPVSSPAALAVGSLPADQDSIDRGQFTMAVIDARRSEFFASVVSGTGESVVTEGPVDLERLTGLASELVARLGPGIAVGDGACIAADSLRCAGVDVWPANDPRHLITGRSIIALADTQVAVAVGSVVPAYLRPSDAELIGRPR